MAVPVLYLNLFVASLSHPEQLMVRTSWETKTKNGGVHPEMCDTVMQKVRCIEETLSYSLVLKSSSFRISSRNLDIHKTTAVVVEIAAEFSDNSSWLLENKFRSLGRAVWGELQQLPSDKRSRAPQNHLWCLSTSCPVTLCLECARRKELRRQRSRGGWCDKSSSLNVCLIKAQNITCPRLGHTAVWFWLYCKLQ